MHKYFIKTPWIVKLFFSSYVWRIHTDEKEVFLTFDDGPHPTITPWVLDLLKSHDAKATFFCIGNNVKRYPNIYQRILDEGHSVGNHTYHHLNGWKVDEKNYLDDITNAAQLINSNLFRPPYGRIKLKHARQMAAALNQDHAHIIMWDVLSADFDSGISKEQCLSNVISNYTKGSVIVFHDSEKAFPHLKYALPKVLEIFRREGYICRKIECVKPSL